MQIDQSIVKHIKFEQISKYKESECRAKRLIAFATAMLAARAGRRAGCPGPALRQGRRRGREAVRCIGEANPSDGGVGVRERKKN